MVELYGFFSWNLSAFVFFIYMIWAFVPDDILKMFGINYIPNKYYAVAFPLWFAVTMFTTLILYVTVCMFYTPAIDSYMTLQDKHTILKKVPNDQEQPPEVSATLTNLQEALRSTNNPDYSSLGKSQSHEDLSTLVSKSRLSLA